jgi:hypothetical protein
MSKRTLLLITVVAAALAPTVPEAQVYFWRDARNVANYSDVCAAGAACGTRLILLRHIGSPEAAAPRSANATEVASNTAGNYPTAGAAQLGVGGMAGATGGLGGGLSSGGGGGAGGGGGGGANSGSASLQTQPRPAPSAPTPSTPAPNPAPSSEPTVTAASDAGSTQIAANTSTSIASHASPLRSPIGTNLEGISYWSPELPFVNVMKMSSDWISGDNTNWDNQKPLDLDSNGWVRSLAPGQIARKLMLREMGDRYPGGRYVVRYKGEGVIGFGFAAKMVSQKPGEILVDVTPDDAGFYMYITQTNPANYVHEIDVTMPGGICAGDPFTHVLAARECKGTSYRSFADNHASILFYPVFLERLRAYSVLRFMDWMGTNNSPVKTWEQRTPLSYSSWFTTSGAPVEVMVELANVLHAHPWFNMPHQSDETYIASFAQLVAQSLASDLRVYVEDSNEVWNAQFSQYGYGVDQAQRQAPPIDNMQYHALRTHTIGSMFKAALGSSRVSTVLGAQAVNPWTATQGLDYLRSRFGQMGIDAVAIAPYFGVAVSPAQAAKYASMTIDQLLAEAQAEVSNPDRYSDYRSKVVNAYKIALITYEGGQHMVGAGGAENNAQLNALLDAFNRDPRVKQVYLTYLAGWKNGGGQLFMHFNDVGRYTKWGRWGALEYIAQPRTTAPKFDALQSFIEQNPIWWTQ